MFTIYSSKPLLQSLTCSSPYFISNGIPKGDSLGHVFSQPRDKHCVVRNTSRLSLLLDVYAVCCVSVKKFCGCIALCRPVFAYQWEIQLVPFYTAYEAKRHKKRMIHTLNWFSRSATGLYYFIKLNFRWERIMYLKKKTYIYISTTRGILFWSVFILKCCYCAWTIVIFFTIFYIYNTKIIILFTITKKRHHV